MTRTFDRAAIARASWVTYWRVMRRYHRFSARGLAILERPGAALIVGYHGRPMAHDLCMLQTLLLERTGSMPQAVMHTAFAHVPPFRWLIEGGGFVVGDGDAVAALVARGDKLIVTPGGTREGYRSFRDRYRVDWGERLGYLRLALKYRLPIIPTAASGVDETYVGLNDGYALGKRLRVPGGLPVWLALGPLGPWPLSPPFPVRITLHVGEPIDPSREGDPSDRASLLLLHARITGAVQELLDAASSD
jgi:hypothetical protein